MTTSSQQARRITQTLFAAQSLSGAATVAIFPIISILGARLSGRDALAGVPAMAYLLGAAFAAFGWGILMDRWGRRTTLALGMLIGAAGGTVAGAAVLAGSFAGFLLGGLLIGVAVAAVALSRFVAAEVHPPQQRGRAISTVVLAGTVGGIAGPLLAGPMGALARRGGLDELAGPFGATVALFAMAAIAIFLWLRPEPKDLAAAIGTQTATAATAAPARSIREILSGRAALVAVLAMVLSQLVMAMLMVITPLHMRQHEHQLTTISYVISVHVVGMYAFSILSGRLADRWGRGRVIATGSAVLAAAAVASRVSPQFLPLAVSLFLIGLGWNFCYVGGSSLLADQLSPAERARTQGFNDLLIGLASAAGSLGSGIVFAAVGFGAMGLVGATVALFLLSLTAWSREGRRAVELSLP
jgi:MFS family permease